MTAKQLKSMLTHEQLSGLRQEEIDSLYGSTPQRTSQPTSESPQQSNRPVAINDAFKNLDEKYGVKK